MIFLVVTYKIITHFLFREIKFINITIRLLSIENVHYVSQLSAYFRISIIKKTALLVFNHLLLPLQTCFFKINVQLKNT